jgi:hypothetical protein
MNPYLRHPLARAILLALSLLLTAPTAIAQQTPTTHAPDFAEFQLIAERNIFNPNRSSRPPAPSRRVTNRAPVTDSFTLVGTLGDPTQWIAFFDGTRPELRGRLKPGDTIGDYTLTTVTNGSVQLLSPTNTLHLRVGTQLRREDQGPWQIVERNLAALSDPKPARPETLTSNSSTPTGSDDADNEVLRRLRQQRERELQ